MLNQHPSHPILDHRIAYFHQGIAQLILCLIKIVFQFADALNTAAQLLFGVTVLCQHGFVVRQQLHHGLETSDDAGQIPHQFIHRVERIGGIAEKNFEFAIIIKALLGHDIAHTLR